MHRLLKMILLGLAVLVAASGCDDSGGDTHQPANDTVIITQMKFHPASFYADKWDTIVWINQDMVSHDITQFPDKSWTSDTIPPGGSWKTVVGTSLDYFCSIHPAMKGKVMIRGNN